MRDSLIQIGEDTLAAVKTLGEIYTLSFRTVVAPLKKMPRWKVMIQQMYSIGNRSVPVVLLTGLFTGMVLAAQSYSQFRKLGIETLVGAVVCPTMAQELGPVLTGLMLAGRVGAAMAAELGTMKVTEQIDALESLATDPYGFLIFPRLVACLLLTPILVIFADFIGIAGGYLLTVNVFNVPAHFYMLHSREYLDTWGLVSGALKGIVFGGLICILSCHKGFTAGKGAEGVGKATTEAVVISSIMILISNFFLTLIMY